jgi:hypothetical protein
MTLTIGDTAPDFPLRPITDDGSTIIPAVKASEPLGRRSTR